MGNNEIKFSPLSSPLTEVRVLRDGRSITLKAGWKFCVRPYPPHADGAVLVKMTVKGPSNSYSILTTDDGEHVEVFLRTGPTQMILFALAYYHACRGDIDGFLGVLA